MNPNLRLMNLGEILDRTIQIYRSKFWIFVTLAAVPALAMMGLEIANQFWWGLHPPYTISLILGLTVGQLGFALAVYHFNFIFHVLVWPNFVYLATRINFDEQPTLSSALLSCIARWQSWLWMTILFLGAALVLPELASAGLFLGIVYLLSEVAKASASTMEAVLPAMMIAFILLGWVAFLWLAAILSLAFPAWTMERLTVRKALLRSLKLSKRSRWRIIFARFMPALIGLLLNYALLAILLLLVLFVMKNIGSGWNYHRNICAEIGFLSTAAASTLIGPIFPIAITLIYYDQRIRQEGYDIERMMEAAGLIAPGPQPSGDGPDAPAEAVEGQA